MSNIDTHKEFLEIFKKCLKIEAKTISVKTLLSDRNIKRIDYKPYYQRNYVWDKTKQTFFIESVILGTEIPPLIFFKSGLKIEVIDGRQRFETLKNFKENDLKLNGQGLLSLNFLEGKNFNSLSENYHEVFWSSNIRIFEFEVVNYPDLSPETEDRIKKEIFRRYNTGITPLTTSEVDNAKYIDDKLTEIFDDFLEEDSQRFKQISNIFVTSRSNREVSKADLNNYFRKLIVLNNYPIYQYANGKRKETLELIYDLYTQQIENCRIEANVFFKQIEDVVKIHEFFSRSENLKSKLIYECILWAIRVTSLEGREFKLTSALLLRLFVHYKKSYLLYDMVESHYYKNIINRFSDTASLFQEIFDINLDIYIKNSNFKSSIQDELKNREQNNDEISGFNNLRFNKPAPISTPIEEIITDVNSHKYLIRPVYQRQEKISQIKASSIIESILLKINLPPIFIYKRTDGIKEVIDGQQRLLSILGFLGKPYIDESGSSVLTKKNNYKLKGLRVLTELNKKTYSGLSEEERDQILDFTIDVIIIEENLNKDFQPTDLFIRLNNKPYPIKENSFEMWNSTVDKDIIATLRKLTNEHIDWFYIKKTEFDPNQRNDRMENEELITSLSYLTYHCLSESSDFEKIIGFFKRSEAITCRLLDKKKFTEFLLSLEHDVKERYAFKNSIKETSVILESLKIYFDGSEDSLNSLLNVRNKATFRRRSLQDFYVMWIVLLSYSDKSQITKVKSEELLSALRNFRNVDNREINDAYLKEFKQKLRSYY